MPKTFPIHLEVEEIALGTVLRKLNDMPGIAKIDLNLGHGGQGTGKQKLQQVAAARRSGGNNTEVIIKLMMSGPKSIKEFMEALGGKKASFYTALSKLKAQGISESAGTGVYRLTPTAAAQFDAAQIAAKTPALPAPQAKHGPAGRAVPGSGPIILRAALNSGPMSPGDLRAKLTEGGMSPKGVSGVITRAKMAGLIKKNGTGYELTAKGQKIETGVIVNG